MATRKGTPLLSGPVRAGLYFRPMRATTPRRNYEATTMPGNMVSLACPYCGQQQLWTRAEAVYRTARSVRCESCWAMAQIPDTRNHGTVAPVANPVNPEATGALDFHDRSSDLAGRRVNV